MDLGTRCSEDCNFGTFLPARASYYTDLASCAAGKGVTFTETARCDAPFDGGNFIGYGAARCCCAQSDFVAATQAERQKLCQPACAKDPYPKVRECEQFGSGCEDNCLTQTRGMSNECAACLVAAVSFMPSGCGSRDCVCGGASFPSLWNACADACASTRQHERELYAAEPRPLPVGRSPLLQREMEAKLVVYDVLVDAENRVWLAAGKPTPEDNLRMHVAVHDADLNPLWTWDDPGARQLVSPVNLARVGEQVVATANISSQGTTLLLFFNSSGLEREAASPIATHGQAVAFGADMLVKQAPLSAAESFTLAILDREGKLRLRAPAATFEGVNLFWSHAVHAPDAWTLVTHLDSGGIQWRRVSAQLSATPPTAVVAWTHKLEGDTWAGNQLRGALAAGGGDIIAWGTRSEKRENVSGSFPLIAQLGADGTGRWQWSNAQLVTPGEIVDARRIPSGQICTVGDESWEYSRADPPQGGARCSPDGCEALTVRCFGADGAERWKYHHRSERSSGIAIAAADGGGALYVAGKTRRDAVRSTGSRSVLMKFEPAP